MIREFSIKSYKSILDLELELGRINLFIGENGCGKTNILEAVAMAGAAATDRLDSEELYLRGIRVAKPAITLSSFAGVRQRREIELGCTIADEENGPAERITVRLAPKTDSNTSFQWVGLQPNGSAAGVSMLREDLNKKIKWLEAMADLMSLRKESPELAARIDKVRKELVPPSTLIDFDYETSLYGLKVHVGDFLIYNANQVALRGLMNLSRKEPLGINGENLDVAIAALGDKGVKELLRRSELIRWVERVFTDPEDKLKLEGYKLGRSTSTLYFRDRFMRKRANTFSAENANEGILHALFYLTLFISERTPKVFGIDNIETALNPRLCRDLVKQLAELAKAHGKQALITTHNPAALDGLNLHDDDQRLFVIARNDAGHTVARRIQLKPEAKGKEPRLMLSEMWMRGHLGGIPLEF